MNGHSLLDLILWDILRVNYPTDDDWAIRFHILQELRVTIESVESLRGATVEPYGSFVSDLFTRSGDLDISIELHNGSYIANPARKQKQALLSDLQRVLRRRAGFFRVQFISNARVPILKFETNYVSCDISVNNLCGQMKSKLLFWINGIDGRFRDLVLLVKEWAKAHHINDSKNGTFNSYCLSLLVIFHLQTIEPAILPPLMEIYPKNMIEDLTGVRAAAEIEIEKNCGVNITRIKSDKSRRINQSTLSELFVSFLTKFSDICSRASTQGVNPYAGQWEDIDTTMRWLPKTYALFVEDPFEQPANTARTVSNHQMSKIAGAIISTHAILASEYQTRAGLVATLARPHIISNVLLGGSSRPNQTSRGPRPQNPRHTQFMRGPPPPNHNRDGRTMQNQQPNNRNNANRQNYRTREGPTVNANGNQANFFQMDRTQNGATNGYVNGATSQKQHLQKWKPRSENKQVKLVL